MSANLIYGEIVRGPSEWDLASVILGTSAMHFTIETDEGSRSDRLEIHKLNRVDVLRRGLFRVHGRGSRGEHRIGSPFQAILDVHNRRGTIVFPDIQTGGPIPDDFLLQYEGR